MTEDAPKTFTLHARFVDLDGGRRVEAGQHDDSWYIKFHNGQGGVHTLRLSNEAATALVQILTEPLEEIARWTLRLKGETWEKVVEGSGALSQSPQGSETL